MFNSHHILQLSWSSYYNNNLPVDVLSSLSTPPHVCCGVNMCVVYMCVVYMCVVYMCRCGT